MYINFNVKQNKSERDINEKLQEYLNNEYTFSKWI